DAQVLRGAVEELQGKRARLRTEVATRLDFVSTNEGEYISAQTHLEPAFIPADYISQPQTRIQAYKRLAEANSKEALQKLARNWRDQFGPHPQAVRNLLILSEIKLVAARTKVVSIEVKDSKVMLMRGGDYLLIGDRFPRLTSSTGENNIASLLALLSRLSCPYQCPRSCCSRCCSLSCSSFQESGPLTPKLLMELRRSLMEMSSLF